MTVKEIMSIYREMYMKINVKPSTYNGYSVNIDNHILPSIGSCDADELTFSDIDSLINTMRSKNLGNTTIRYVLRVLKMGLAFAQKRGYCTRSIMNAYDLPKKSSYSHTVLSSAELKKLRDYAAHSDSDSALCVLLMICHGLRRGECLGLKYSDISENRMSIRRTSQFSNGKFITTDCKTEKSRRDILIFDELVSAIEKYNDSREKNPDGYLIRTRDGKRLTQNVLQREFKEMLKALNLPNIRIHDLRHSYATLMVRNGVNPKIVSSVLGHSTVGITLDLYSHADISMQKNCIEALMKSLK